MHLNRDEKASVVRYLRELFKQAKVYDQSEFMKTSVSGI
jgi:hypothetical protein